MQQMRTFIQANTNNIRDQKEKRNGKKKRETEHDEENLQGRR